MYILYYLYILKYFVSSMDWTNVKINKLADLHNETTFWIERNETTFIIAKLKKAFCFSFHLNELIKKFKISWIPTYGGCICVYVRVCQCICACLCVCVSGQINFILDCYCKTSKIVTWLLNWNIERCLRNSLKLLGIPICRYFITHTYNYADDLQIHSQTIYYIDT